MKTVYATFKDACFVVFVNQFTALQGPILLMLLFLHLNMPFLYNLGNTSFSIQSAESCNPRTVWVGSI